MKDCIQSILSVCVFVSQSCLNVFVLTAIRKETVWLCDDRRLIDSFRQHCRESHGIEHSDRHSWVGCPVSDTWLHPQIWRTRPLPTPTKANQHLNRKQTLQMHVAQKNIQTSHLKQNLATIFVNLSQNLLFFVLITSYRALICFVSSQLSCDCFMMLSESACLESSSVSYVCVSHLFLWITWHVLLPCASWQIEK